MKSDIGIIEQRCLVASWKHGPWCTYHHIWCGVGKKENKTHPSMYERVAICCSSLAESTDMLMKSGRRSRSLIDEGEKAIFCLYACLGPALCMYQYMPNLVICIDFNLPHASPTTTMVQF